MSGPLEPAAVAAANELGIPAGPDAATLSIAISLKRIADALQPATPEPCRHCNDAGRAPRLNGADRCGCPAAQKEAI